MRSPLARITSGGRAVRVRTAGERPSSAETTSRRPSANLVDELSDEVWFTRRVFLRWLPPGLYSIRELATRLGRHPKAVTDAVRQGRIPRVTGPWLRGVAARVSDAQLEQWRARSLEAVLADLPALPQRKSEWRTVSQVALHIGASHQVAAFRLQRLAAAGEVTMLEWEADTPFRRQRRFWLPRFPRALTRGVRGGRPSAEAIR
jgi:hypothetical protein